MCLQSLASSVREGLKRDRKGRVYCSASLVSVLVQMSTIGAASIVPAYLKLEIHPQEYLPPQLAARRSVLSMYAFTCQENSKYMCGDVSLEFTQIDDVKFAWIVSCSDGVHKDTVWEDGGYQALWCSDGSMRPQFWYASYNGGSHSLRSMRFVVQSPDTIQATLNVHNSTPHVDQRLESFLQKAESNILHISDCMKQQVSNSQTALTSFTRHLAVQFKHQNDRRFFCR